MSRRFPVAIWQDAQGAFTAVVLDGAEAAACDRSQREALLQLKRYLGWALRNEGTVGTADFEEPRVREHRVLVRAEYQTPAAVYPVSPPLSVRVPAVHAERQDGTRVCVLPTLGITFGHSPTDPVEELIAEAAQRALGRRTPQEISRELAPARILLDAVHVKEHAPSSQDLAPRYPSLETVAERLGQRTRRSRFPRAIERDELIASLKTQLDQQQANLLLMGESGVGKTTLLVEAVRQLVRDQKPDESEAKPPPQFWLTSGQRLIAGMQYLGQWEERCEKVIEELAETRSVLCITDLLELVRVGSGEPASSVAAFLAPFVERGELRMVAEVTPAQVDVCRRLLPGLVDLFQIVPVPEFPPARARKVLETLLDEGRRNLQLEPESGFGDLIYRLFKRFQPYAAFPGRSAGFVRQLLEQGAQSEQKQLTQADVLERFERDTGLPEFLLRDDVPLPHDEVLAHFNATVLGQPAACRAAAGVVTALKTGLNDPLRPLGVLLFCGPTGVGKTELAKALSRYLFGAHGAKDRLARLDMSEYGGYGAADRLLMSSDGEVSDFLKRVRRQPFVVVLLDEVEKAAPEVHDALLGMLDEGRLTDRFGRTTTFRSAVIVMTSNLGAERSASVGFEASAQPAFERIAMQTFRPEFFNRIDAVVTFQPLSHDTIRALARRELESLAQREGLAKSGLRLTWSAAVEEQLAHEGFDARYGARPLQRTIERRVVAQLAKWLLENSPAAGAMLHLDLTADGSVAVIPR